jgi:hypothetical protein
MESYNLRCSKDSNPLLKLLHAERNSRMKFVGSTIVFVSSSPTMELITVAKEKYSGYFSDDIVGGCERHSGRKGKLAII